MMGFDTGSRPRKGKLSSLSGLIRKEGTYINVSTHIFIQARRHTDLKTQTHTKTLTRSGLLDATCWSVIDRCFIISSHRDRGNCLLLSGLFPTEQDLRHVHSAQPELLIPSQRNVIKAKRGEIREKIRI